MKKTLFIILLLCASSMLGQFKSWSNIYSLELGAILCQGTESGSSLNGYNFSFTYDYVPSSSSFSTGVNVAYMKTNEELSGRNIEYSSLPILFQAKWFFLPKTSLAYLQGGVGIHNSRVEAFGDNSGVVVSDAGVMFLAGVGTFVEVGKNIFITAGYNFNWMDGNSYQNGIVHNIKIGMAFQ
jgi:hypothetical protein